MFRYEEEGVDRALHWLLKAAEHPTYQYNDNIDSLYGLIHSEIGRSYLLQGVFFVAIKHLKIAIECKAQPYSVYTNLLKGYLELCTV